MLGYIFHVEARAPLARDTCVVPVGRVDLTKSLMWRRARRLLDGKTPRFFSQVQIPDDFTVAVAIAHFPDYQVRTERSPYAQLSNLDPSVKQLVADWLAASLEDLESRDLLFFMLGDRLPSKFLNYTKDLRLVTNGKDKRRE